LLIGSTCFVEQLEADISLSLEQVAVVRLVLIVCVGKCHLSEEGQAFPFLDLRVAADFQDAPVIGVDKHLRFFAFLREAVFLLDLVCVLLPPLHLLSQRCSLILAALLLEGLLDCWAVEWQLLNFALLQ